MRASFGVRGLPRAGLGILVVLTASALLSRPSTGAPVKPEGDTSSPEPSVTAPVLPAPVLDGPVGRDEYVVGPNDVLALSLWGEVNVTAPLTVTPEGILILPVGGTVEVSGLTIAVAEERVRRRLSDYYRDVELTLSLVTPRRVIVHVTGAVKEPGEYTVSAAQRVSGVVELAGGLLAASSERLIELRGPRGAGRPVDLLRYRRLGDLAANPLVMEGSVVFVPYRTDTAVILGAVNAAGEYEVVPGDRLQDLIDLAGGPLPAANLNGVEIVRFRENDASRYDSFTVDLRGGAGGEGAAGIELRGGDRVFVHGIERWHRDARVEVLGEVMFAGTYSIIEGEDTLSDVIARAGGLTPVADLARARLRRQAAGKFQTGAERQVELLESFDRQDMTYEEYAFLQSQRLEVSDEVSVDFSALLLRGDRAAEVALLDEDLIEIPRALSVVRVSGAVKSPGLVKFTPGARVEDYIGLAGDYTRDADRARTRIVKSQSGSRLRPNRGTTIEPGDIVWVPRAKERDWWEIAKDLLSVGGQVATIYILIQGINK
jgi:protein involved in polysaccharide export with SLBB domain